MLTIQPNGNIKLYSGIRLDNTYQNALSFENAAARTAFFHNDNPYLIATLTKQSYQRVTSGQCDIEMPVNELYNCNYMAFQNHGFSNRWFYAFVTNVEYINNITTRVFYEIDVLTTFYFDWSYLPSFVEREHTATDAVGDNIVPENIQFSEPVAFRRVDNFEGSFVVVIAQTDLVDDDARVSLSGDDVHGFMLNGIYMQTYNLTDTADAQGLRLSALQTKLKDMAGSKEDIVSIFMFPKRLVNKVSDDNANIMRYYNMTLGTTLNFPTNINGYTPKNRKLFTFPYCYICADNGTISNNYRWEWFQTPTGLTARVNFVLRGAICPGGSVYYAPIGYKGLDMYDNISGLSGLDRYKPAFDERIELPPLPQVAYPIDSFLAWLAQTNSSRKNKLINQTASGAVSGAASGAGTGSMIYPGIGTAVGALAGGIIGGVTGAIGAKVSNDQAIAEAADMKNHASGGGNGSLEIIDGKYGVTFKYMGLNPSDAKMIDDYFTMFGYAINAIKTPAIRTRPHWNYIKTSGLNMAAQNVPADYVRKIKDIHNAGVTYWKVHDEIGNYNLNNQV